MVGLGTHCDRVSGGVVALGTHCDSVSGGCESCLTRSPRFDTVFWRLSCGLCCEVTEFCRRDSILRKFSNLFCPLRAVFCRFCFMTPCIDFCHFAAWPALVPPTGLFNLFPTTCTLAGLGGYCTLILFLSVRLLLAGLSARLCRRCGDCFLCRCWPELATCRPLSGANPTCAAINSSSMFTTLL